MELQGLLNKVMKKPAADEVCFQLSGMFKGCLVFYDELTNSKE